MDKFLGMLLVWEFGLCGVAFMLVLKALYRQSKKINEIVKWINTYESKHGALANDA